MKRKELIQLNNINKIKANKKLLTLFKYPLMSLLDYELKDTNFTIYEDKTINNNIKKTTKKKIKSKSKYLKKKNKINLLKLKKLKLKNILINKNKSKKLKLLLNLKYKKKILKLKNFTNLYKQLSNRIKLNNKINLLNTKNYNIKKVKELNIYNNFLNKNKFNNNNKLNNKLNILTYLNYNIKKDNFTYFNFLTNNYLFIISKIIDGFKFLNINNNKNNILNNNTNFNNYILNLYFPNFFKNNNKDINLNDQIINYNIIIDKLILKEKELNYIIKELNNIIIAEIKIKKIKSILSIIKKNIYINLNNNKNINNNQIINLNKKDIKNNNINNKFNKNKNKIKYVINRDKFLKLFTEKILFNRKIYFYNLALKLKQDIEKLLLLKNFYLNSINNNNNFINDNNKNKNNLKYNINLFKYFFNSKNKLIKNYLLMAKNRKKFKLGLNSLINNFFKSYIKMKIKKINNKIITDNKLITNNIKNMKNLINIKNNNKNKNIIPNNINIKNNIKFNEILINKNKLNKKKIKKLNNKNIIDSINSKFKLLNSIFDNMNIANIINKNISNNNFINNNNLNKKRNKNKDSFLKNNKALIKINTDLNLDTNIITKILNRIRNNKKVLKIKINKNFIKNNKIINIINNNNSIKNIDTKIDNLKKYLLNNNDMYNNLNLEKIIKKNVFNKKNILNKLKKYKNKNIIIKKNIYSPLIKKLNFIDFIYDNKISLNIKQKYLGFNSMLYNYLFFTNRNKQFNTIINYNNKNNLEIENNKLLINYFLMLGEIIIYYINKQIILQKKINNKIKLKNMLDEYNRMITEQNNKLIEIQNRYKRNEKFLIKDFIYFYDKSKFSNLELFNKLFINRNHKNLFGHSLINYDDKNLLFNNNKIAIINNLTDIIKDVKFDSDKDILNKNANFNIKIYKNINNNYFFNKLMNIFINNYLFNYWFKLRKKNYVGFKIIDKNFSFYMKFFNYLFKSNKKNLNPFLINYFIKKNNNKLFNKSNKYFKFIIKKNLLNFLINFNNKFKKNKNIKLFKFLNKINYIKNFNIKNINNINNINNNISKFNNNFNINKKNKINNINIINKINEININKFNQFKLLEIKSLISEYLNNYNNKLYNSKLDKNILNILNNIKNNNNKKNNSEYKINIVKPIIKIFNKINQRNNLINKPVINQYLNYISKFNIMKNGIILSYNNIISYNFNNKTNKINKLVKNIYILLNTFFKAINCFISKPIFIITPDKIIIQLFYYVNTPFNIKDSILKIHNPFFKLNLNSNFNSIQKFLNFTKKKIFKKKDNNKLKKRFKLYKLNNFVLNDLFKNRFKILCSILNKIFNKSIEFDLIRLHYPYNDSNILVNLIYYLIKKISIRKVLKKLFKKAIIKKSNFNYYNYALRKKNLFAFVSGININFGGRFTKKIIPRKSRKIYSKGIISKNKINYLDISRISNKNRLGSYSITITSGQTLF